MIRMVDRLTEIIVASRLRLDRWLLIAAFVAPLVAVVAGAVHYAMTGTIDGLRFLALYVAPMFLAAPIWVRIRLVGLEERRGRIRALDAIIFLLAVLRFIVGGALPFSGHMLFLTYTLVTVRAAGYRWLVGALLLETTVFKLIVWHDLYSWSIGLGLGLAAAILVLLWEARP